MQGQRPRKEVFGFFFAFCVNKDSDETFDRVEEEKNRELLKRRTEALSLCGHLMSELWRSRSPSG